MGHITRIVLVFFLLISSALAESLEIKVNQTPISLPYWPAPEPHYGAVLLVRGGEHAEWSTLLAHFAEQLAHYGWSVVLLNCDAHNSVPWIAQVPEAISALRMERNKRIILVHYGDQLNQSLDYFSKPQSKMINGLVMLSAYDDQTSMDKPSSLRFPLFDIAGQFDYDEVLNQRVLRGKEFKQRNYLSLEMPGAHHDYEYSQRLLLAFVHGWMAKLPEFEPQPPPILVSYLEPIAFLPSYIASIEDSDWSGFMDNPD